MGGVKRLGLVVLLLVTRLVAQETAAPVTLAGTEFRKIHSERIGQTYELLVSLPQDYATSAKAYPVLYILDGWHFPLMAYFQNNNVYSERMPPVIMVNIGHGPNGYMPLRARDFTPTHHKDEPTSGGAAAFLDFLEREIIPLVDRTYRTVPTDRGLLGHSYGGLFALYALLERPALFQRIVAASPVAGWDGNVLFAKARSELPKLAVDVRLDLSTGDEDEEAKMRDQTRAFTDLLDQLKPAKLDYRFTVYSGENHTSVRFASFPSGLYWVYRPLRH